MDKLIYILGFIATWWLSKKLRNATESNDWGGIVMLSLLSSLFSWIGFVAILLVYAMVRSKETKPPKWM